MLAMPFVLAGSTVASGSLYLLTLSVSAFFTRRSAGRSRRRRGSPFSCPHTTRPSGIAAPWLACAPDYPPGLFRVAGRADNCTDATAALAASAGADVLERHDRSGAGRARRCAGRWTGCSRPTLPTRSSSSMPTPSPTRPSSRRSSPTWRRAPRSCRAKSRSWPRTGRRGPRCARLRSSSSTGCAPQAGPRSGCRAACAATGC